MSSETSKSSFERINYYLRPNKQVERKIMIDMLQQFRNEINLSEYCYLGMGSIYYYDFILIHKMLGIDELISIDDKTTVKRFDFNKPYEFIKFENCITTDYLRKHEWRKKKTIAWLDYDSRFERGKDYIISDLKILAKNCGNKDIIFISVNAQPPKDNNKGKEFLNEFQRYISADFNKLKFAKPKLFPRLLQNIFLNILKEGCEFNDNKFHKICAFTYKDGASMYTLGGIFNDDATSIENFVKLHKCISADETNILNINIPNITYKEKFYLDSKINSLRVWLESTCNKVETLGLSLQEEKNEKLKDLLAAKMEIELSPEEVTNYLNHYKYFPQYYEGVI